MEAMTVAQVSRNLGISTRMLRYYEKEGLVTSLRREGYAYRLYDDKALSQIRQILILRKLRIPVRQIRIIMKNSSAVAAIEIFRQNMDEVDEEITALAAIRDVLNQFVDELSKVTALPLNTIIPENDALLTAIESLTLTHHQVKGETSRTRLEEAEHRLLKISEARIIYLPPSAIAASQVIGADPEFYANRMIDDFVREQTLDKIKPDLRQFGFNHPNPIDETGDHGYEAWVTIPEDMEVPAPLVKKHFCGGLYAAHTIAFGNFNEWGIFLEWIKKNEKFEFAGNLQDQQHMCGLLEEHLNYFSHLQQPEQDLESLQLDLLMPIREKTEG